MCCGRVWSDVPRRPFVQDSSHWEVRQVGGQNRGGDLIGGGQSWDFPACTRWRAKWLSGFPVNRIVWFGSIHWITGRASKHLSFWRTFFFCPFHSFHDSPKSWPMSRKQQMYRSSVSSLQGGVVNRLVELRVRVAPIRIFSLPIQILIPQIWISADTDTLLIPGLWGLQWYYYPACMIMYSTVCIYAIISGRLSTSTSHHL